MSRHSIASVDSRGFDWRLRSLQRKLEWELDVAKACLEQAGRTAAEAKAAWDQAHAAATEQATLASGSLRLRSDPNVRRCVLAFLVQAGDRIALLVKECERAEDSLADARTACADAERKLDVLLAVREVAWKDHARRVLRGEANEADAAWLSRRRDPRMGAGAEVDA
jgi:hypothetical protein